MKNANQMSIRFVFVLILLGVLVACASGDDGADDNVNQPPTLAPSPTPLLDEDGNVIDPFDPALLGDSNAGNAPLVPGVRAVDGLTVLDYAEYRLENRLYLSFVVQNTTDEAIPAATMIVTLLDEDNIRLRTINLSSSAVDIPPQNLIVMQGATSLEDYPDYVSIAAIAQVAQQSLENQSNTYAFAAVPATFDADSMTLSTTVENGHAVQLTQPVAHFLLYDADGRLIVAVPGVSGLGRDFWQAGSSLDFTAPLNNLPPEEVENIDRVELNLFAYHYPAFD